MDNHVIVQVPREDREDLAALLSVEAESYGGVAEPLDAATLAQVLVLVNSVSLPILHEWLKHRAAVQKSYKVIIEGAELTGYTPAELEKILGLIDKKDKDD